jgi:MYXO-CTERM domain-containing protein
VVNGEQSDVIRRQDGQTVRKGDEPAAAVIEQYLTSGEPTTDLDNVPGIQDRNDPKNLPSLQGGGDDGCGCSAGGGGSAPGVGAGLLLLALGAGLRRRRR